MTQVIVSDTTSLIVLEKLASLNLLCQLFDGVLVPRRVMDEVCVGSPDIEQTFAQLKCFDIIDVAPSSRLTSLSLLLDEGEAHAIELATSRHLPLIIDEKKGRQVARQLGIKVTGFAGLLVQATRSKVLDNHQAMALLDQAMADGLRLSDTLYKQVKDLLL